MSLVGSVAMCSYFVARRDPVGILADLPNSMIYLRNLHLIRARMNASEA
ncbi:MAG TPA: lipid-A-disaccharide synthase N-terminal domain-containing protein [Candidatus Binataceae bacterium]